MKKAFKISLLIIFNILLIFLVFGIWAFSISSTAQIDDKLLSGCAREIIYLDQNEKPFLTEVNGIEIASSKEIPKHVKNAFISIEDKRFYKHNGIDYRGLIRATFNNVKSLSFKEGGSTITQQLIKNTHLTNEKTLKRKIIEFKLAKKLETKLTKDQILDSYLNTIYFGEGCYGITSASKHYFNKAPSDLTIDEGAMLAGIIKAPFTYSPNNNLEKCLKRRNLVLENMCKDGFISSKELLEFRKKQTIIFPNGQKSQTFSNFFNKEAMKVLEKFPYTSKKFYVNTTIDYNLQKKIETIFNEIDTSFNKTICIQNAFGEIKAYLSSCGNINRQPGSTLKPIAVYLPAIEKGVVDSCSYIKDEKINIDGYSPKNYLDKYNGEITIKESLSKSSNVCAVKLLKMVGIDNSLQYLQKTDLEINDKNNGLALALGATTNGVKLTNLLASYNVFLNNGNYYSPVFVKKIHTDSKKNIYFNKNRKTNIFYADSIEIVREMLKNCVENGTAKKLNNTNRVLYAKTGTVGNKNGNTDAYTISFNKEYILGVWVGSKDKQYLSNSITGGTFPCVISNNIWDKLYQNKDYPSSFDIIHANKIPIDKISYEKEKKILIADEISDERYVKEEIFTKKRTPKIKSKRFTSPKLENVVLFVNNNGINMSLCVPEHIDYIVYDNNLGQKRKLFDSKNLKDKNNCVLKNISKGKVYNLSIIPYYEKNNKVFYGNEIFLNKIKTPTTSVGDDWWDNL